MAVLKGGEGVARYLQSVSDKLSRPATLRVGVLEDASYPDGTPVALVAVVNEFGAPGAGIPPRPFMRNAIAKYGPEWPKAIADLLKANNYDLTATFEQTGLAIAGQIKQSIVDTNEPALAPSTIARKGSSKPLIDTGVLIGSIDHEVEEG